MKHITKIIIFLLALMVSFVACDNNATIQDISGETPSGDVDAALYSITLGQVVDNVSAIEIPLGVFGSSSGDLSGATADVYINGSLLYSDLNPSSLYHSAAGLVMFVIKPLYHDTVLGFVIHTNTGASNFYEGIVSEEEKSYATLAATDFSISDPAPGDVALMFDEKQTNVGDATGSDYSGTYDAAANGYTYSDGCTEELLALVLPQGEVSNITVLISHSDGDMTWDDTNINGVDYAGIIDTDGSFEIFTGNYVDENNYMYTLIHGGVSASLLAYDFMAVIELDGTRLDNGLSGSCTVSASFIPVYED
jgi:hypothetical protein